MKKKKFKIKRIIYVLIICYIGYSLVDQQIMINRINNDISKYTEQSKKVQESNESIKDQIEFAKTDEYMERAAREKIGLIRPGETVYVIDEQN